MSKIVITHVGTSLLTNRDRRANGVEQGCASLMADYEDGGYLTVKDVLAMSTPSEWDSHTLSQAYHRQLRGTSNGTIVALVQCLKEAWNAKKHKRRDVQSAEISSIRELKLQAGDEIVLFASDTVLGCLCAVLIRDLLLTGAFQDIANSNFSNVPNPNAIYIHPIERIEGLEVKDKDKQFVSVGLTNYFGKVKALYAGARDHNKIVSEDAAKKELVFNVTAGYKAMIPFASILAMLLGSICNLTNDPDVICKLFMYYEDGGYPIELHGLVVPIEIDAGRLDEYKNVLKKASNSCSATEEDAGKLPMYLQQNYLEKQNTGEYCISANGRLALTINEQFDLDPAANRHRRK